MSFISDFFAPKKRATPVITSASAIDRRRPEQRVNEFADELKSALLSVGKNRDGKVIGIELGERAAFRKQVDDLVGAIKTSYNSYSTEIGKAAKIKELNKNLVTNFKKNLQVMVDVTNLLNSYVQLFEVIKTELTKLNTLVGKDSTNLEDISYLEQITQRQVESLQREFEKQSTILHDIYGTYDMAREKQEVTEASSQVQNIIRSATDISNDYRSSGGAKTKKPRKKQPKKASVKKSI